MIDLKPFCGVDPFRSYLHEPFSRGDYTYATDGCLCLRVSLRPQVKGHEKAPNPEKLGWMSEAEFILLDIHLPADEDHECENCDGSGREHQCPDCECECPRCEGTGHLSSDRDGSVEIRGIAFAMEYIRKILTLPGIAMARDTKATAATMFRFKGGDGLLMPLRGKRLNHIVGQK